MALTLDQKTIIIEDYKQHATDTGSPEVQVALLTKRINELTEHFKIHTKDFLLMKIQARARLEFRLFRLPRETDRSLKRIWRNW